MSLIQDALKRKAEETNQPPAATGPSPSPISMLPIPQAGSMPEPEAPPTPPPPSSPTLPSHIQEQSERADQKEPSAWPSVLFSTVVILLLLGGLGYGGWYAWEKYYKSPAVTDVKKATPATAPVTPSTLPSPNSIASRVHKTLSNANAYVATDNQSMTALDPTPGITAALATLPPGTAIVEPAPTPDTSAVKVVTITQTVAAVSPPPVVKPPAPPPVEPKSNIKWPELKITGAGAGKKGFAIINGQVMSVGEETEGVVIKEILSDRVVVEKEGQTHTFFVGAKKN